MGHVSVGERIRLFLCVFCIASEGPPSLKLHKYTPRWFSTVCTYSDLESAWSLLFALVGSRGPSLFPPSWGVSFANSAYQIIHAFLTKSKAALTQQLPTRDLTSPLCSVVTSHFYKAYTSAERWVIVTLWSILNRDRLGLPPPFGGFLLTYPSSLF